MVNGGLAPPSELLDAYRANPPMVTIDYRLSPIAYRLSTIDYRLSTNRGRYTTRR